MVEVTEAAAVVATEAEVVTIITATHIETITATIMTTIITDRSPATPPLLGNTQAMSIATARTKAAAANPAIPRAVASAMVEHTVIDFI